jgi:MFS family permease
MFNAIFVDFAVSSAPVVPQESPSLTAAQYLTTLITMESLLFAAFNVGVAMTSPVAGGRRMSAQAAFRLAKTSVAALTIVAGAGLLAWWQVFADDWPSSTMRVLQALGIAVGILVQPIVSFGVAMASRPPKRRA